MRRLDEDLRHIPVPPLDVDTIVRRGERLRARRKAMFAGLSVATVVAVAIAATWVALLSPSDPDFHVGPARLENTVDVNVYLDDGITPRQREDVTAAARSLEGVVTLNYVSKSDAFAEFKEIYRTQPEFWENLPRDALPARLVVTLEGESYVSEVARALSSLVGVDEVTLAEERSPSPPPSCPASEGGSGWTSPETLVASGSEDGNPWVLCARTATSPEAGDGEGFCMNWSYGQPEGSGLDCSFSFSGDRLVPLDENYVSAIMGPAWGFMYGAVPKQAATVELESDNGDSFPGEVYPAPDPLGVPFKFFTIFAEPYAEGTLVVRDEEGDVIRERDMEHGLSILTVDLAGEGKGRVVGYRTESLSAYEQCRDTGETCREPNPMWIDCGSECSVGLDGASITLVAEPAEGSDFVGWTGACEGTARCSLTVDETTNVTARFERGP